MKHFLPICCLLILLAACTNNRDMEAVEPVEPAEPGSTYQNFQVWGKEDAEAVTVRLQFHEGGKNGDASLLAGPGKVYLDNTPLPADSSKFNGVYYEVLVPVETFRGEHTIRFTDANGQEYKERFVFEPFSLATELPAAMKKVPFDLQLKNFPEEATPVRLVMIDTAMASDDVNETVMVENGKLSVTEEFLANLTEGPIFLEVYREKERPVKNKARGGGKIFITYALKRQFAFVR